MWTSHAVNCLAHWRWHVALRNPSQPASTFIKYILLKYLQIRCTGLQCYKTQYENGVAGEPTSKSIFHFFLFCSIIIYSSCSNNSRSPSAPTYLLIIHDQEIHINITLRKIFLEDMTTCHAACILWYVYCIHAARLIYIWHVQSCTRYVTGHVREKTFFCIGSEHVPKKLLEQLLLLPQHDSNHHCYQNKIKIGFTRLFNTATTFFLTLTPYMFIMAKTKTVKTSTMKNVWFILLFEFFLTNNYNFL